MLDLKYYLNNSVEKEADRELLYKYYKKIKFESLNDLIYFFKNIQNKVSFIRNETIKQRIISASAKIEDRLSPLKLNYTTFLNNEVFPHLDYFNVAGDLNPKHSGSTILLECPCCSGDSKKHNKKDNRDAFVVKVGNHQTGTIKCNRANNCGETTSIVSHIMSRDGLNFRDTVSKLASSVGIDLFQYERSLEKHLDGDTNSSFVCEKEDFSIEAKQTVYNKNKFGLYDIDFKKPNLDKAFKKLNIDTSKYNKLFIDKLSAQNLERLLKVHSKEKIIDDFRKKRLLIVYSYIRDFSLAETDRDDMYTYFANRGIPKESLEDVGCLKASKIKQLVDELKNKFDEDELIEFGILDEKYKSWKYGLVYTSAKDYSLLKGMESNKIIDYFVEKGIPKEYLENSSFIPKKAISGLINQLKEDFDENMLFDSGILKQQYKQNDSAVFSMHGIYDDMPTNLEFKFYGNLVKYSKRKAVSMANSLIVDSNYYGEPNNIDFIKNEKDNIIWWTEGAVDAKTLNNFGIKSNALIGVQKHFDRNLGFYTNKISVIAFDEDKAGHKGEQDFAKKLMLAGVKNVFIAKWDSSCGKDLNDILKNKNFKEINLFSAEYDEVSQEITLNPNDVQKIPLSVIEEGYKKANLPLEYPQQQKNMLENNTNIINI